MLGFLLRWFGPVFAKEMIEVARRRRYYLNRILYAAALFVAFWITWEESGYRYRIRTGQMTIQESARMANELFTVVSVVQYGAVWLLIPVMLCAAIAGEREAHTLDLLLTTKLNDREIVLGKLASRLVLFGAFVASGVPVLFLSMGFGGIEASAIWNVQASTLLATLFAAAHAMYFSTTTHSPVGALVRTYFWLAVWLLGLPALGFIFVGIFNIRESDPAAIIIWAQAFINPIASFVAAVVPEFRNEVQKYMGTWIFVSSYVVPTMVSMLLLWRAVVRLRRPPVARRWIARMIDKLRAVVGASQRALRGGSSLRTSNYGHYEGSNPLLVRARQALVYDRERHLFTVQIIGWLVAFGVLLFIACESPRDLDDEEMTQGFVGTTWIGVALLATLVSAGSLVGDRSRGFLDQVLVTPLDASEIVDGTARAARHHVRVGVWLALTLTVLFMPISQSTVVGAVCATISALLFLRLLMLTGVGMSLAARSLVPALVGTLALPLTIGLGVLPLLFFEEASGPILWLVTLIALPATWAWSRRSASPAAVASFFVALHLALVGTAECWTYDGGRYGEFPIVAMNPAVWVFMPLVREFPAIRGWHESLPPIAMLVSYWAALAANIFIARNWIVRNFDRLVGRR